MSPGGIHVCSLGVAIVDCELFALSPGDGVTTLLGLLGSGPGLENCGEHVGLCTTCSGCTRSCVTAACSFEPPYWLLNLRLFHDVRGDGGGRGDSAEDCALWRNSPRVRILSHFALLCAKSSKTSAPREGRLPGIPYTNLSEIRLSCAQRHLQLCFLLKTSSRGCL